MHTSPTTMQTIKVFLIIQLLSIAVITGKDNNDYFSIRLDNVEDAGTSSPLDRMALRLDYQGTGVRIGKAPGRWDALRLQYLNGNHHLQARGKKDDLIIPVMIGFKSAMLAVAAISSVGLFVFKSLVLSKIALVLASVLLISKLFSHDNHNHHQQQEAKHHEGLELDYNPSEIHPVYDYNSDLGYMPTAGGQYIAYSPTVEGQDASATNIEPQYSQYQEASVNNTQPQATMQRRKDFARKKTVQPISSYITIRRKSVSHSGRDLH